MDLLGVSVPLSQVFNSSKFFRASPRHGGKPGGVAKPPTFQRLAKGHGDPQKKELAKSGHTVRGVSQSGGGDGAECPVNVPNRLRIERCLTDPRITRRVRVFVSSTFKDMQCEREQMVKYVFPELEKICMEKKVFFSFVDLRWGITQQDADRLMPACLLFPSRNVTMLASLSHLPLFASLFLAWFRKRFLFCLILISSYSLFNSLALFYFVSVFISQIESV